MDLTLHFVDEPITNQELQQYAAATYIEMVKGVVDVERGVMVVGGELHADSEQYLLEHGSKQENLWGINFYPNKPVDDPDWLEFDSMINLRPAQNNRSRGVDDPTIQQQIRAVVSKLVVEHVVA